MVKPSYIYVSGLLICICFNIIAAKGQSLAADQTAILANIKLLSSENSRVRELSAAKIRRLVVRYSGRTTNLRAKDGSRSQWAKKVAMVKLGMAKEEVLRLLPLFKEAPERSEMGSGMTHSVTYRLDYDWMVTIHYQNPGKVIKAPELIRRSFAVWVDPPENYNGVWVCYHANGKKAYEIHYKNRQYDGTFTRFHDNGKPSVVQHFILGTIEGPHRGYYPNGKLKYTALYSKGKKDGRWLHYFQDGKVSSESNYKDGVQTGVFAQWYPNGKKRLEINYLNDLKHGIEASWNEAGQLQYKRDYENGNPR